MAMSRANEIEVGIPTDSSNLEIGQNLGEKHNSSLTS